MATAKLIEQLGDLSDWRFTGNIKYHPQESLDDWYCVCGVRILYAHIIKNNSTGDTVAVGSECVGHFTGKTAPLDEKRKIAQKEYHRQNCDICNGSGEWHNPDDDCTYDCPGCVAFKDTERGRARAEIAREAVRLSVKG